MPHLVQYLHVPNPPTPSPPPHTHTHGQKIVLSSCNVFHSANARSCNMYNIQVEVVLGALELRRFR